MPIELGPLVLTQELAAGAMGRVWEGMFTPLGRRVAVKIVHAEGASDREWAHQFRREAALLASLSHPDIVWLLDIGMTDARAAEASEGAIPEGVPYLVMEHLGGGSLEDRMGRMDQTQTGAVLNAVLGGLGAAHAVGLVHRDLKPANIVFGSGRDSRSGPKLCDFGIAVPVDTELSEGSLWGTPAYMAPEHIAGEGASALSDLYSVGCIAWALLMGRPPFQGSVATIARRKLYEAPPALPDDVAAPMAAWVHRLMQTDPLHRFVSAAQAAHALDEIGADVRPPRVGPSHDATPSSGGTAPLERPMDFGGRGPAPVELSPPTPVPFPASWHDTQLVAPGLFAGPGAIGHRRPRLVGRINERNALWDALRGCVESRRVVFHGVQGSAGTGKSRLARWHAERSEQAGVADALVVAVPRGQELVANVEAALQNPRRVPGMRLGLEAAPCLDGTLDGLVGCLDWLARRHPLVLWCDVEVVDRTLEAFILATSALEAPLFIGVCAHQLAIAPTLCLEPLGPGEFQEVAAQFASLSDAEHQRLYTLCDGSPTVAHAVLSSLAASGGLVPTARGLALREGETLGLPRSMQSFWKLVIGQLVEPEEADGLAVAATLGRRCETTVLQRACRAYGCLAPRQSLDRLADGGHVQKQPDGWVFADPGLVHAIVDDRDDTAALHRACASAIDPQLDSGAAFRHAVHLFEAQAPRAPEALRACVEDTSLVREHRLRAAEALVDLASEGSAAWFDAQRWRCMLVHGLKRFSETEALARMLCQASDAGHRAVGHYHLGAVARKRGQEDAAFSHMETSVACARRAADPELEAHALAVLADFHRLRGDIPVALSLLDEAEQAAGPTTRIALFRAQFLTQSGEPRQAIRIVKDQVEVDPQPALYNALGNALRALGDFEAAKQAYARCHTLGLSQGSPVPIASVNMAMCELESNDPTEAMRLVEGVLQRFRMLGYTRAVAACHATLLWAAAATADWQLFDEQLAMVDPDETGPDFEHSLRRAHELAEQRGETRRGGAVTALLERYQPNASLPQRSRRS